MLRKSCLSLLGLVAAMHGICHAGQVVLSWDYPLDWQADTRYVLHIITLRNGAPIAMDRTIDPFTPQQCRQWPGPSDTPETLCGAVCLEPGDYSLSLRAQHAGTLSAPSNILDVDLSSTTSCTPVASTPPPAPVPAKSSSTAPAAAAGAAVVIGSTFAGGNKAGNSTPSLPGLVNMQCVSWKILGPCFCNPYTPCVTVEYWEPGWLVETVKRPGTTAIPLLGDIVQAAFDVLGVPPVGGGGAGNANGNGHTNLQYNEAHVIPFPQLFGGPCTSCAPSNGVSPVNYVSEADPQWRTAIATPTPLDLIRSLGVWAHLYPRGGKAIHSSEPVGSGIAAARAMDIAFNPVGEPPNIEGHVVEHPTGATSRCCQLASPRQTSCFPVGTPPVLWEQGTVSPRGTYLWLFWRKRTCCVNPHQASCGITLAGGQGANACILP